jgi:hypothetical protein
MSFKTDGSVPGGIPQVGQSDGPHMTERTKSTGMNLQRRYPALSRILNTRNATTLGEEVLEFPRIVSTPLYQRLTKEEAMALFRKFDERHSEYCDGVGIDIEVQRPRDLEKAVWNILHHLDIAAVDKSESEIVNIVKQFAKSGDVLYCYSRACEEYPDDIEEDWEMSMFVFQINCTGWSVASLGWEDCIPIGEEGYFLLIRDQKGDAVKNMAQLISDAGDDNDDLRWDSWEVPLETTMFDRRPWREIVPTVLPILPGNNEEDNEDISTRHWSNDDPLFQVVNGGGPERTKVSNSVHGNFILELFDYIHVRNNNVVAHSEKLVKSIHKLRREYKDIVKDAISQHHEINVLTQRIATLELELAGAHDGKASPGEHPIAALPKCHLQSAGGGAGGGGSDSKKKRRKTKQGGEKKDGAAPAKKKRATGGPKGLGSHDVKVDGPPATPGDEDDNTPAAWEHNGILDNFCKHAGPLEVAQGMSERLGREEEANRQYVEELDKALSEMSEDQIKNWGGGPLGYHYMLARKRRLEQEREEREREDAMENPSEGGRGTVVERGGGDGEGSGNGEGGDGNDGERTSLAMRTLNFFLNR